MSSAQDSPATLLERDFEEVRIIRDPVSGLCAVLAIHDTSAGPALGGIRCRPYPDLGAALADAQQLARAMTYKCALAEIPGGGGKVVILDHPDMDRPAAYRYLGERIQELGGRFYTGRDLGTTDRDLAEVAKVTRFVTSAQGISNEHLDEMTAEGVFLAAGTCLEILGIAQWGNVKIAIQGLGEVGLRLAVKAARVGAEVFACDTDAEREGRAVDSVGLTLVEPDAIFEIPCEVFSPCATGNILDLETIGRMRCKVVAGAANNQLASDEAGDLLHSRGILYAPDFVVNSGAVLAGCASALPGQAHAPPISTIGRMLREILVKSLSDSQPTHRIAAQIAEARWQRSRARRVQEGRSGRAPDGHTRTA